MSLQTYQRLDLASRQLETAIGLFIGGHDKFSVITLAGAADGLLSQLVANKGEKTFVETLAGESDDSATSSRGAMGTHVNRLLFINAVKHMDDGDDGILTLDLFNWAFAAIMIAVADLVTLQGRGVNFVEAFLLWVKQNLDPNTYNIDCDPHWKRLKPANQEQSDS